jgi:aminoglycoside phosphotransferase family enzyme
MSWVFLTKDRVFKLKKPVRFSYLNFSTPAAREAACKEELRINQVLAPDVYLRVAALTRAANGRYALDGVGQTHDWLVVMRRLPAADMLDARLRSGGLTREQVEKLVPVLAGFYADAPSGDIGPDEYVNRFHRQLELDREIVLAAHFSIDHERATAMMEGLGNALERLASKLRARVEAGRIIEAHGDLRPEHICLCDPIRLIDRLEFDRRLRLLDPIEELSFLGMECAVAGAPWIGPLVTAGVMKALGDSACAELVHLHWALRASLRARLSLAHLLDEHPREPARWAPQAERHLDQAGEMLNLPRPTTR